MHRGHEAATAQRLARLGQRRLPSTALARRRPERGTRVDVVIGYALTGHWPRSVASGLVRDLVRRIGEAFAQNLDARLCDPESDMPQARLGGLSLLLQVVGDRLRALFARLGRPRG